LADMPTTSTDQPTSRSHFPLSPLHPSRHILGSAPDSQRTESYSLKPAHQPSQHPKLRPNTMDTQSCSPHVRH
jgi:hypothetical protein